MPVVKKSVQDTVFRVLKEGIMSLRLAPGTVMSTMEMAERLNVSRTPVRESFIRLQEEGLVDVVPQKETVVSRIDFKRMAEERFIRGSLELSVAEPFIRNCRPMHIEQLKEILAQQKEYAVSNEHVRFVEADNELHRMFFEVAEKKLAWNTLMSVNSHDYRFRVLVVRAKGVQDSVIDQHEKLIRYAADKDLDGFRGELHEHLKKMDTEKQELLHLYPDYFVTEETVRPFEIRSL